MSLESRQRFDNCCLSFKDNCCSFCICSNWFWEKLRDAKPEDLSFCNCSISLSSTLEAIRFLVLHGSLFGVLVCCNKDAYNDGDRESLLLVVVDRTPIMPLFFLSL